MSLSSYLLLITNIYVHCSFGLTTCSGFTCKWTVNNYVLDLTPFQFMGLNLTATDRNNNVYYYTPCNNLIPSSTSSTFQYMAVEVTNGQQKNYLAQHNPNLTPVISFDSNGEPVWKFQYTSNFTVEYICDPGQSPTSYLEIKQVLETFPDSFIIQVSSRYTCNNVTVSNDLAKDRCIWYDDASSEVLDLRPLYGQSITYSSYYLYLCQNAYRRTAGICSSSGGTSGGCCASYGYSTSAYGIFDPLVEPSYDAVNYQWTFDYPRFPNSDTPTVIQWECDPLISTYQVLSGSSTQMRIASAYACPDLLKCTFVDSSNENNILDLTKLYGEDIRYVNQDTTYSFEYSVCSNAVVCNGTMSVMAMRWNIYETDCDPYLAVWEGSNGYDLSYDDGLQEWKFTYDNGERCGLFGNTEFSVYWRCNQTVSSYQVTSVQTINSCQYAMYIDSSLAC